MLKKLTEGMVDDLAQKYMSCDTNTNKKSAKCKACGLCDLPDPELFMDTMGHYYALSAHLYMREVDMTQQQIEEQLSALGAVLLSSPSFNKHLDAVAKIYTVATQCLREGGVSLRERAGVRRGQDLLVVLSFSPGTSYVRTRK